MDSKTYTITLTDGTVLDNLKLNGNNFISNTPINADIFNENCSPIIISDGVNSETYNNMELVQITEQEPGKYWFVLRELSASELAWIKTQSDIELARNYTNEKLNSLPSNRPTKTVNFDGGIYSIGSDVVNGQVSDCRLLGNTYTNLIKNGNFADGTEGWEGNGATISVTGNILTVKGNGINNYPYVRNLIQYEAVNNKRVFVKCRVRVTNSDCTSIRLGIYPSGGSGSNQTPLLSPVQNQWYTVFAIFTIGETTGGNIQPEVYHIYTDAETANGKVMEVQEVFAIDMGTSASDPLYNLTAEEMNMRFPHWFNGTKSTNSVRVKSVGKNLLKPFKSLSDFIFTTSGISISFETDKLIIATNDTFRVLYSNPIKVKPNTPYRLSVDGYSTSGYKRIEICDSPVNTKVLSYLPLSEERGIKKAGFNAGDREEIYIRFYVTGTATPGDMHIYSIQLEEGSTYTEYEPYKESSAIINLSEPLRSVGSVKDEFNVTSGIKTQRVGNKTNVASGTVINYTDMATGGQFVAYAVDGSSQIGVKGDTLTITAVTLIYQLATPIVTKLPAQAPLQVFENGTVYVEPIGDPAETTLPSVELTVPIGTSNKFGVATHDYGGAAADWVLTKNEANCGILIVTNAGGTANIIAPNDLGRFFFVKNDSGYDVVVKSAGAEAGTTIADGNSVIVFNTGD